VKCGSHRRRPAANLVELAWTSFALVPAAAEMRRSPQASTEFCRPACTLPPSPSSPCSLDLRLRLMAQACLLFRARASQRLLMSLASWLELPPSPALTRMWVTVGSFLGRPKCSLPCWRMWLRLHQHIDNLAAWSKALAPGASPQGRGFQPHRCHLFDWLWLQPGVIAGAIALAGSGRSACG
jgi:hypothetical protein